MEIVLVVLLLILIAVALIILYYVRHPKYRKQRKGLLVSPRTARYSRRILRMLRFEFEKYYGRQPNQNELMRLIIMTSHIVIKQPTWNGHWLRWKIRMFLASENGVWYGKRASNNIRLTSTFGATT